MLIGITGKAGSGKDEVATYLASISKTAGIMLIAEEGQENRIRENGGHVIHVVRQQDAITLHPRDMVIINDSSTGTLYDKAASTLEILSHEQPNAA